MRYIKAGPFLDRKGQQVKVNLRINTPDGQGTFEPNIGQILWFLLDAYEPSQELRLTPSEMKNMVWPALDVLEKGPNKKGYYTLENGVFDTLRKVVTFYAERLAQGLRLAQQSPIILSWFDEAGENDDHVALEPAVAEDTEKRRHQ